MTEKRYFVSGYSVWDSYNNNKRVDTRSKPVCDLLNNLHEENEVLKKQREELFIRERDTKNDWRELKQENEQLKQQIHYLKIVCRNELDEKTLKQVMGSLGDIE